MNGEATLPLERFIQAVQSQLDNAQTAMAVKARNLSLPLTFAIKDISLDLRAHVEFTQSEIRIRPAAASDKEASQFHLVFTTITRPMIEENSLAFSEVPSETSIDDLKEDFSEEERKRLDEWGGVRNLDRLRDILAHPEAARAVARVSNLPLDRLRRALARASSPQVSDVVPVAPNGGGEDVPMLMRIRGRNLRQGALPTVMIAGEPVSVVRAEPAEVVIAPQSHQFAGELSVTTAPGEVATAEFDLRPFRPAPSDTGGVPS